MSVGVVMMDMVDWVVRVVQWDVIRMEIKYVEQVVPTQYSKYLIV